MPNDFLSATNFITNSVINQGLLRKDHFKVEIPIFGVSYNAVKIIIGEIDFKDETVNYNTVPTYYITNRARNDLSITFLDNADYLIRSSFYNLMSVNGFNENKQTRGYYKDFQMGEISVIPLRPDGSPGLQRDVFKEVFVSKIDSIEYDRTMTDLLYTVVTFKYRFHDIIKN